MTVRTCKHSPSVKSFIRKNHNILKTVSFVKVSRFCCKKFLHHNFTLGARVVSVVGSNWSVMNPFLAAQAFEVALDLTYEGSIGKCNSP